MPSQTENSKNAEKDPQIRAHKSWQTIRSIATREDDETDAAQVSNARSITHGVYRTTKLISESTIKSVTHNLHSGQYLILHEDRNIEIFLKDGSREKLQPQEQFDGIIYALKPKLYVTWNSQNLIQLMTQTFKSISSVPSSGDINCMIYNEFKNEIVSAGCGIVIIWMFRLNNTLLVPKLTITDKLGANDDICIVAVEPTTSKMQRLFVAIKNGIMVFRLSDGHFIAEMPDLHKRAITDVLFYQPLQVFMTAAADGSIKLWDNSCNLRSLFVGHTHAVTCLSAFQKGPLVLSGSKDGTMRLWNVDTNEEVECLDTREATCGMCKRFGEEDFFTFTNNEVLFWKLNNLYKIFTVVGSKAKILRTTKSPTVPAISYYICDDACIRFACPKNGNVVTVMMSPEWKRITDAVYVAAEGQLFVLLRDGLIAKCSTRTNPCKVEEIWTTEYTGAQSKCNVLCLFEHVLEEHLVGDRWKDLVRQKQFQNATEKETPSTEKALKQKDRTLLIGGCNDGKIVVYKWRGRKNQGKIYFSIEGHRGSIVALASNTTMNQIASCSSDKTVRIWRVFPFAEDAIAPLMFILNNEPATHLVYSRHRLCIVLQDPSTAAFNVTMFKTTDTEPVRIEHSTDDDHVDVITALCCCQKLNIFASASADGTIKIWDEHNRIIRIIKLHSRPSSLCFSTQKGDLLVGIGEHVYKISFKSYLPEKLLRRMVAIRFEEPRGIMPIGIDKDVLDKLDVDQKHRLQKARSSEFLLAKFVDIIPLQELEERQHEEKEKDMAVSILKKRDDDLTKLRNGEIAAKKKPPPSQSVRDEAWRKYLDMFYNRKTIPAIGEEFMKEDDEEEYVPYEERDSYRPDRGNTGFFSISTEPSDIRKMASKIKGENENKKREKEEKTRTDRSLSTSSDFEIPRKETTRPLSVGLRPEFHGNSRGKLLRRILSAPSKFKSFSLENDDLDVKKVSAKVIEVPAATDFPSNFETLRNLNKQITDDAEARQKSFNANRKARGMLPIAPDGFLPNSIIVALYKELKKEEVVEKKDWKPKALTQKQMEELEEFNQRKRKVHVEEELPDDESETLPEVRSRIFEKFKLLSESPSSEKEFDLETPPPTPPRSPTPEPSPEPSKEQIKIVKPLKPIEKLVTRPVVERTPTPPREPTPPPPPRPKTPLPGFIMQFKGQNWFIRLFPNATPELFPKPWTVIGFLSLLLDCLKKERDYETKTQLCAAILILNRQHPFNRETASMVQNALLVQLNMPVELSATGAEGKNQFIKLCLSLLTSLELFDVQFIIELMSQYITADIEPRHHAVHLFHDIGLQDPHGYFTKELDTFTTYGVFDPVQKKQAIKQQCKEWLEKWMQLFSKHISSLAGKIYRAKKGNVVRGTKNPKTNTKGILKKSKKETTFDASGRKISFMPNNFIDDAAKNIAPIDAINYFCEIEYENELERARNATVAPSEETTKSDRLRNTVVLLPKIDGYRSLARLGETHKSCCHPERETALAYDLRLPVLVQSKQDTFNRGLLLHLNTLTLNPFPNLLDELLYEPFANSQLITLRSAPKYFIPSNSYVEDVQL